MTESMVERVMHAVIGVVAGQVPDDRLAIELTKLSGPIARAAIAALREPTEAMKEAGSVYCQEYADSLDAYHSMIDAALKEP